MVQLQPNFLVIGGMRCATGWIRQCLMEHPDIYMPKYETHFFDREYEKGLSWWLTYFNAWNGQKAIGEKTATYLNDNRAADRVSRLYPNMKFICCIRDPIERMYSHYMMNRRNDKSLSNTKFHDVATENSEYFKRSLYYSHLKKYLKHYKKKNILILIYEDKDKDNYGFIEKIYNFLEVDTGFTPPSLNIQMKQGSFEHRTYFWRLISGIMIHSRSPQIIKKIYSKLRPQLSVDINEETYRNMGPLFAGEINGIEKILNRKMSSWKTRQYVDI